MNIVPPPTSFLAFVSARSGSIPVVSQSIIRPIVPVGASTDACELRTPYASPISTASSHAWWAAERISPGTSAASMPSTSSRCMRSTLRVGSRFSA